MVSKKKTGGSRREKTIHEVRGTISDMLKGGKTSSSGFVELDEEMDSLDRAAKQASNMIDHKVAAAYKIKKMEQAGIFSRKDIEQAKNDLGISTEGESASKQETGYNILSTQLANEQDPEERRRLSHELMITNVYEQLKGRPMHEIQTAVNNLKMSFIEPKKTESKTEDFKDRLLLKFIDKNMGEPKSELDNLDKLTSLIDKVQKLTPQSDSLKEMSENIKAYKELGIIKDPATSIEESKLEVEKLKINKEYEIKDKEIESDKQRTKSLADIGGDVLSSAFEAFGAATNKGDGKGASRSNPAVRQQTLQNAMNATCVTPGCGAKILVTNIDQSREINCGGCGQKYIFDSDQKKLFVAGVEQSGPETSGPAPGTNQDTSQSSTA